MSIAEKVHLLFSRLINTFGHILVHLKNIWTEVGYMLDALLERVMLFGFSKTQLQQLQN